MWEEDGRYPDVIFELMSPSTAHRAERAAQAERERDEERRRAGKAERERDEERQRAEQAEQKGRLEGEARMLIRQLERKFGVLDAAGHQKIAAADSETLLRWSDRILTAESLAPVFAEP